MRSKPSGGAHEDDVLVDDEIGAFDELHAHLPREERVLEVGRVEHARREHDDAGVARGRRRDMAQGGEKRGSVVIDRLHTMRAEHAREHAGHRSTVLQDVGDAARVAKVVLEDEIGAFGVPDEVDAGDEAAGATRHGDAEGLTFEAVARCDEADRDDVVLHRSALSDVEVVEEHVEGGDPLPQTPARCAPTRPGG